LLNEAKVVLEQDDGASAIVVRDRLPVAVAREASRLPPMLGRRRSDGDRRHVDVWPEAVKRDIGA